MKLSGVVRTSSPLPHPSSRTARWSAVVPLETATALGDAEPVREAPPRSAAASARARACPSAAPRGPAPPRARRGPAVRAGSARGRQASPTAPRSALTAASPGLERVLERIDERLPRGLDDVLGDARASSSERAVGGVEKNPRDRRRAVVLVEDPDLEVGQLDLGDLRVLLGDRRPQRPVERVDRTVALGGPDVALVADPELDRRLGLDPAVGALLGDDPEALEPEQRLVGSGLAPEQELEGGVRRLVGVSAVLALLDLLDRAPDRIVVELDPGPGRPRHHRARARRARRSGSRARCRRRGDPCARTSARRPRRPPRACRPCGRMRCARRTAARDPARGCRSRRRGARSRSAAAAGRAARSRSRA